MFFAKASLFEIPSVFISIKSLKFLVEETLETAARDSFPAGALS